MIGAFFAWWVGQLAELLPAWLRRPAAMCADALLVAPLGPLDRAGTVAVLLRRGGREAQLGQFALGSSQLDALPRSPRRPIVLRLGRAELLEKALSLPLAAHGDLDQVLAFEMDRETPFTVDEVYWAHRVEAIDRQQGRLLVRLLLVPKASVAALLRALAQAGIAPRWAEIADAPAEYPLLPLDGDRLRPQQRSRWLVRAAAAGCAVLAAGAIATPFARQAVQLTALDREVRAGRAIAAEAETLRREIDRLSRSADLIRSAREKTGRPLEVLAAATRLLPDDAYLTEFELRQRKVTLGGRSSAGAARLIGAFAADGKFRNPSFSAPVTRVEALRAEVFTIGAEVGPAP